MDILSKQARLGALKNMVQKMRSSAGSYKAPSINTNISSRVKMEEDPDYKRRQRTALTGKDFTPNKAPKTPKF